MTPDELCFKALKEELWVADIEAGTVYSVQAHRTVGCLNQKGYVVGTLHCGNERKQVKLHRVIWIAKHGIPKLGTILDHINGDKSDNRIANLRVADAFLNSQNRRSYRGEGNPAAKLTINTVNQIRQDYERRNLSYDKLKLKYGVSKSLIAQIIRKEIWN